MNVQVLAAEKELGRPRQRALSIAPAMGERPASQLTDPGGEEFPLTRLPLFHASAKAVSHGWVAGTAWTGSPSRATMGSPSIFGNLA
jgi:hypothetical protein